MKEVVITYDTLYEILRREKSREEIQKLDESFFQDVIDYIKEKNKFLESQQLNKSATSSSKEIEKTGKQIENIKKILRELYEKRETKIIHHAILSSRTNNKNPPQNLLKEERELYMAVSKNLDFYREIILFNLIEQRLPNVPEENKSFKKEIKNRVVKFNTDMPKFVGDDLKVYGPFKPDDIATIPIKVAEILIKSNKVEIVE